MSVIREARALAAEIVEIDNLLTDAAGREFADECKLGLTLAHLIVEGYVTRVDDKALALLDNAVNRGRTIANRPPVQVLSFEQEGPIFPVGTKVVLRHKQWPDHLDSDITWVVGVQWDDEEEAWRYLFSNEGYTSEIIEGDVDWDVQEFCADEI